MYAKKILMLPEPELLIKYGLCQTFIFYAKFWRIYPNDITETRSNKTRLTYQIMFNILSSLLEWNLVWLSGAVAHLLQAPSCYAFRDIIFVIRFESVVELLLPFYRLELLWLFCPNLSSTCEHSPQNYL